MLKTPPLQTATATIDTLSGRLQSATLLEDRRAAMLGLRSFAKQYPASVASGALRELIATLRRDGLGESKSGDSKKEAGEGTGDVDTIRLVLETLLMLFNPDSNSPEAGEEISLFLADGFSMRQDNLFLLLSLLDPTSPYADYYSRLYSLQILNAICDSRPLKLQECILSAPLGVSRLVATLDDGRDAVWNAGLLLLVDLTSGANEELAKIIAFEDVFAKVFALIRTEGGLAEAGITAQDCLSLLANLVRGSSSNQTMFRESGCVAQLAQLLQQAFPSEEREAAFVAQSREKSAFGVLQLLRSFLVPGEASTAQNQTAFFRAGTAQILINISFSELLPIPIRYTALNCTAELVANNAPLQENFATLTVITPADAVFDAASELPQVNGSSPKKNHSARTSFEKPRTYIIEALLDLTLSRPQDDSSLRHAACGLIQAYLDGHERIKAHFLQRAITGHTEGEQAANVLSEIAGGDSADPTGVVFASWIIADLIVDNAEAKTALSNVKEGNESEGEDVLSFIQTLGSELELGLAPAGVGGTDERTTAAHASLLTVFLWDFAPGVDDLLAEGSSLLQALVAALKAASPDPLLAGLSATLLGTVYEFSTKDSPIPRRTLAPLLTQKLGRRKYLDALTELRRQPAVRDFDLIETGDNIEPLLLSKQFIDLFTLEFSRLRKAIDKGPGIEVLPPSPAEAGVDRDVLDDLRQQLQTAKDALTQTQEEALAMGQRHEQERLAGAKDLQTAKAEVDRLRKINQAMQVGHEGELEEMVAKHEEGVRLVGVEHERVMNEAREGTQKAVELAVRERDAAYVELGNSLRAEQASHTATRRQFETIMGRHDELVAREKGVSEQLAVLSQRYSKLEKAHSELQASAAESTAELQRVRQEYDNQLPELERLNTQLRDLQDELKAKDEELAAERAGFAELETELESAKSAASASASVDNDGTALRKELEEAKESEKSAKEELESMLLVMGDIEAKRDVYRERVKTLGGEVSDDDEEEEEEDEVGGGEDSEGGEGEETEGGEEDGKDKEGVD